MEEAQQLCDRLVVMYQGRILKEGTPSRLVEEEIGREVVEVRLPPEDDARILGQLAAFPCAHERVGDTLYFYCRDGHAPDAAACSSSTCPTPSTGRRPSRTSS
ncbi:MAG: hypothetical protein M0C28_07315 [Candidatus Moduliflexus flocculans]|nr:hypothetical protein [Candidatus Moduliflexus flocculans]